MQHPVGEGAPAKAAWQHDVGDDFTADFQNAPVLIKPYEFDDVKAAIRRMLGAEAHK